MPTEFFGAPASLPAGPGLLAIETGATRVFVTTVRRAGQGRYRARLDVVEVPTDGSRRERLTAFLTAEARGLRAASSPWRPTSGGRSSSRSGPTSWPAARRPTPDGRRSATGRRARRRRPRRRRPCRRSAAPTSTSTRWPRTARRAVVRDPRPRRDIAPISMSSPSPITSGSTPRWPPARWPRTTGCGSGSSSARRSRPVGGHLLALFLDRAGAARCGRFGESIARDPRPGRDRDPGPSRSCRTRCAPRGSVLRRLADDPDPRYPTPTRSRRSIRRCSGASGTARSSRSRGSWACPPIGDSDAHAAELIGQGCDDVPRPDGGGPAARDPRRHDAVGTARSTPPAARSASSAASCASTAATSAPSVRGRVLRDGTGRDLGYPGGHLRPPVFDPRPPGRVQPRPKRARR